MDVTGLDDGVVRLRAWEGVAVTLDRGRWAEPVTPREDPAWRETALGRVADGLGARRLRTAGRAAVRLRPWSVLARVEVEGGDPVVQGQSAGEPFRGPAHRCAGALGAGPGAGAAGRRSGARLVAASGRRRTAA